MEVVATLELLQDLVKSSPPTNHNPRFYRPDALHVAKPAVSKHWRKCFLGGQETWNRIQTSWLRSKFTVNRQVTMNKHYCKSCQHLGWCITWSVQGHKQPKCWNPNNYCMLISQSGNSSTLNENNHRKLLLPRYLITGYSIAELVDHINAEL